MFSTQLWVVIWKKYVTRKRHWLLTILEILMPTVTFLLFVFLIPRYKQEESGSSSIEDDLYLFRSNISSDCSSNLIYSPQNIFYNDIISRCSRKLAGSSPLRIKKFDSKDELLHYYDNVNQESYTAIIFEGDEEKKFDYVIRTDNTWDGRALCIKNCLDLAFIEKVHGRDLEQSVNIVNEEFRFNYRFYKDYPKIEFTAIIPPLVVLGFVFLYPSILKCVVEEKQCGMKELMKMAGMRSWMIWLGWLLYAMTSVVIGIMIVVILLKYFPPDYSILTYTDGSIMFVFLLLYGVAAVAFCFAISSFFSRPSFAITAGIIIWILTYFLPWTFFAEILAEEGRRSFPWIVKILICLLPNTCLYYGFVSISDYETRKIGVQWSNFYKAGSDIPRDLSMLNVYLMFITNAVLYTLFTFYMDRVHPGKYGVRESALFPIYSLVELTKKLFKKGLNSENVPYETFENVEAGDGLQKGIEIENLCKNFSGKLAVNNLNLDIYKNQITILLGHNGAGKTTTMSMITGMLTPTSGRIKFDGKNLKNNMDLLRTSLGMCPQHNLFCSDFTVEEHLIFFSMLRGRSSREARLETLAVLETVKLSEKRYSWVGTLSGGMKRKLCLAMALVGNSNVLVLDEPTAGMDPESQREVWNLLLKWRENKTILLTTHFMEEADALADWVAILANGTLQCYGTPMYLKKQYDTGYHLSLMINGGRGEMDSVMNSVCRHTEEAKFLDSTGNNLVFVLPVDDKILIADLLAFLEKNKRRLRIENISLTITTLEDVFLKAKMESESGATDDHNELLFQAFVATDSNTISHRTLKTIFGLFRKRLQYYKQKIFMYLLPVFLISMLILIALLYILNFGGYKISERRQSLNLDEYGGTEVYYSGPNNDSSIRRLKSYYKEVVEEFGGRPLEVTDVQQAIWSKSRENFIYADKYMVAAASFFSSPTGIDIVSHSDNLHTELAINLVMNALARFYQNRDYSISTTVWSTPHRSYAPGSRSEVSGVIHWCIAVPLGFLFVLANFIIFPHAERTTTFKHLQYMSGVTPWCYWIVNFLCDFFFYLIVVLLVLVYFMCMFPWENIFAILFTMLFGCGAGSIPLAYLFSRKESAAGAYGLFLTLGVFLIPILTPLIVVLNPDKNSGNILRIFSLILVPPVSLIFTGLNIFTARSTSDMWENVMKDVVLMIVGGLLYLIINIMVDFYPFRKGICRLKNLFIALPKHYNSSDTFTDQQTDNMLIVENLHKSFQKKHIVKGVSFTLNEGRCLGILGVNGAGKTTTFRMLTGEIVADNGVVEIVENDRRISIDKNEYLQKLGYCPQSDALNLALSARQILTLFADLRGLNKRIVNVFLKIFELEELADIPCADYSGGNKRKLSLAVALLGYPKYVLLDEPTNGVDPSSRRKFWKLVRNVQEVRGVSFILTSHSMVECEALCSYMKIMKAGVFVKEGTIAELKRGIGGFSVKLKLIWTESLEMKEKKRRERDDETEMKSLNGLNAEGALDGIEQLKTHFVKSYNAEIKDEHSGLLHVYIKDRNKRWSELFKEIETIKMKNPHLIEDYVISEATLEDVFLSVARS